MDKTTLRDKVLRMSRGVTPEPDHDDVDDLLEMIQQSYIQPVARIPSEATFATTTENQSVSISSVASDVYEWRAVYRRPTNTDYKWELTPIVNHDDLEDGGIRFDHDTVYFQRIGAGVDLRFLYFKLLPSLKTVESPALDERWHDLYWLGASSILSVGLPSYRRWLNPRTQQLEAQFQSRLDEFRRERLRHQRRDRPKMRLVRDWG